jgi:hypothetical protein
MVVAAKTSAQMVQRWRPIDFVGGLEKAHVFVLVVNALVQRARGHCGDYLDYPPRRKANFLRQMADAPAGSKLEHHQLLKKIALM